jgi:uncharacterized protein (TIGR02646 family)
MRPVDKGAAPAVYQNYQDAGPALQQRLGEYCSYCERRIETHLAVEHIRPKSLANALRNTWSNFLLACVNCNSNKGNTIVNLLDLFWPDTDNTLRALTYNEGGLIQPNAALPGIVRAKAQATIELTGLDRYPGNPRPDRRPTSSDKRWLKRLQTRQLAERDRHRLLRNNSVEVRELIIENALGHGMFSVWWTAFADDIDMRRRLRQAFLGTDPGSFDADEHIQLRAGGQV